MENIRLLLYKTTYFHLEQHHKRVTVHLLLIQKKNQQVFELWAYTKETSQVVGNSRLITGHLCKRTTTGHPCVRHRQLLPKNAREEIVADSTSRQFNAAFSMFIKKLLAFFLQNSQALYNRPTSPTEFKLFDIYNKFNTTCSIEFDILVHWTRWTFHQPVKAQPTEFSLCTATLRTTVSDQYYKAKI